MLLSPKSIGSLTNPPVAAPMFAALDPLARLRGFVPLGGDFWQGDVW